MQLLSLQIFEGQTECIMGHVANSVTTVRFWGILIVTSQMVFHCGIFLELLKGLYDSG